MEIITVNVGTSSIKCALYVTSSDSVTLKSKSATYPLTNPKECVVEVSVPSQKIVKNGIIDFEDGVISTLNAVIASSGVSLGDSSVIGIRVVHGGEKLTEPTLVTPDIFSYLDSIKDLAPLHNPPALHALTIIQDHFPTLPIYAVFDTGFHSNMPPVAHSYAVSKELQEHHVRRFGFHGLAYASMLRLYANATGTKKEDTTIIALQLGSGCSICAIKNGVSVDTSMGFSPLEGLISRTRTGSIDPSVIPYLSKQLHESVDTVIERFNKNSGLAGMTGTMGQMSDLLILEQQGNDDAKHAIALFLYRIIQYMGSYDAVLGGAHAFVFGGGIIEHNPKIWQRLFSSPYFGVHPTSDPLVPKEPFTRINVDSSRRPAYIALVDEEQEIAHELTRQLTGGA